MSIVVWNMNFKKKKKQSGDRSLVSNNGLRLILYCCTCTIQVHTSHPHSLHWSPHMPCGEISFFKKKGKKNIWGVLLHCFHVISKDPFSTPTKGEGRGKKCLLSSMKFQSANAPLRVSWRVFKKAPADPKGAASLAFVSLSWSMHLTPMRAQTERNRREMRKKQEHLRWTAVSDNSS